MFSRSPIRVCLNSMVFVSFGLSVCGRGIMGALWVECNLLLQNSTAWKITSIRPRGVRMVEKPAHGAWRFHLKLAVVLQNRLVFETAGFYWNTCTGQISWTWKKNQHQIGSDPFQMNVQHWHQECNDLIAYKQQPVSFGLSARAELKHLSLPAPSW